MRIGIVGLGSIAHRVYLPLLSSRTDLEIVGVMSRSAETVAEVARAYRIPRRFTALGDLLDLRPDLVFIHAPTPAHHELVAASLAAGAHVFVDKPLAASLAECADLAGRADRLGRLLAVGFNRRFAPMYLRARDWVTGSGLQFAVMEKHRTATPGQTARDAVFDDLIHVLDTLAWLLGPAAELTASELRVDPAGRFRLASGSLRTADAAASYAMVRSVGADLERLAVYGTGRSAEVMDLERAMLDAGGDHTSVYSGSWETVIERRGFDALVRHVLDTVATPYRCDVAARRVLPAHRLAEALVRGSRTTANTAAG